MSLHSINDPKHWLDRAKEARALAEQMNDPEAKRTMLKNADDYERLAQRAETTSRALATVKVVVPHHTRRLVKSMVEGRSLERTTAELFHP